MALAWGADVAATRGLKDPDGSFGKFARIPSSSIAVRSLRSGSSASDDAYPTALPDADPDPVLDEVFRRLFGAEPLPPPVVSGASDSFPRIFWNTGSSVLCTSASFPPAWPHICRLALFLLYGPNLVGGKRKGETTERTHQPPQSPAHSYSTASSASAALPLVDTDSPQSTPH